MQRLQYGPRAAALLLVLMQLLIQLSGCASSPPSTFYTLTAVTADRAEIASLRGGQLAVGLGPVSFPRFLDRPQVVQRAGGNQLTLDEFNRWGGSLDDDFLRVFSENLGRELRTSRIVVFPSELRLPLDFRVLAEIIAFEAGPADQAMLKVRWAVLNPSTEEVLRMREDVYRQPLPAEASIAQQVVALSTALAEFSQDVARELQSLPRPQPLSASTD
ncbi:hypothetical protein CKO36_15245 [Rhabdochromatium marinum]|nr:hypothetical protein [Rhabdochromatium marinum]